jgi:Fe-S cluster biosynthesis and repair protein YggX
MRDKNDYLDLGLDYLKNSEPLEDNPQYTRNPIDDISKKDLKKEKLEQEVFQLESLNSKLEAMLDPKFNLKESEGSKVCDKFINNDGRFINHISEIDSRENYLRLIKNEEYTKQIKDKKFQSYLKIRKNYERLFDKIYKSGIAQQAYLLTSARITMDKLDNYLSSYLQNLVFKSSKENIIGYIKSRIRSRKK